MATIRSTAGKDLYKTEIRSTNGKMLISDEPKEMGGKDLGFSPFELIAAALAACTSATTHMYAKRKGWDLNEVKTRIHVKQNKQRDHTSIERNIEFVGELDVAQRTRLLGIANVCPVHKALTNTIEITTTANT